MTWAFPCLFLCVADGARCVLFDGGSSKHFTAESGMQVNHADDVFEVFYLTVVPYFKVGTPGAGFA